MSKYIKLFVFVSVIITLIISSIIIMTGIETNEMQSSILNDCKEEKNDKNVPQSNKNDFVENNNVKIINDVTNEIKLTEEKSEAYKVQITINDILNNPINDGIIKLDDITFQFKNGFIEINNLYKNSYNIAVGSNGYQLFNDNINFENGYNIIINLDYLYNIDFELKDTMDAPIKDALVKIWKGDNVIRPIKINGFLETISNEKCFYRMKDGGIWIKDNKDITSETNLSEIEELYGKDISFISIDSNNYVNVLDSFSFIDSHTNLLTDFKIITLNKNKKIKIPLSKNVDYDNVLHQKYTNNNGMCNFINLHPACYYYQIFYKDYRSNINSLLPYTSKIIFKVDQLVKNKTLISINKKIKEKKYSELGIAECVVTLRNLNSKTFNYIDKTDRSGNCVFIDMPYGKYEVEIFPPMGEPLSKEINIQEINNQYTFYINNFGYDIRGAIVDENNKPIVESEVDLYYKGLLLDKIITNEEGVFYFESYDSGIYTIIINDDEYVLSENLQNAILKNIDDKYTFINDSSSGNMGKFKPIVKIQINKKSIDNLIIQLKKGIKTTFSGTVYDTKGQTVSGAVVSIGGLIDTILQDEIRTNEFGQFNISLTMDNNQNNQRVDIFATKKIENKITKKMVGSHKIIYNSGDKIENIDIAISDNSKYKIVGKINNYESMKLESLIIRANFLDHSYNTELDKEGIFQIDVNGPGSYSLNVLSERHFHFIPNYGTIKMLDFCDLFIPIEITDNNPIIYQNIDLIKSSVISGRIVNRDNNPYSDINIMVNQDPNIGSSCKTNKNGYFWITGVQEGVPCNLHFYSKLEEQIHFLNEIIPPTSNINLQINK